MTQLLEAKENNWIADLAFEVALGYFTPEELQNKYEITPDRYEQLVANPTVKKAINAYRRSIDEEGQHFRIKARRMASEVLDTLFEIAAGLGEDGRPVAAPADRIKAADLLCKYSGLDKKEDTVSANQGFQVNIQINQG